MKTGLSIRGTLGNSRAFTIVEMVIAMAIIGIAFVSLYGGIASSFGVLSVARENLRANQIMVEKLETIRLYHWDQINSNGFIAPTFTASFFPTVITNVIGTNPDGTPKYIVHTNGTSSGVTYYGTVQVTNAPVSPQYASSMKMVNVSLTWTNGNVPRRRSMQTLITANGLQDYIFN
ncbi:MAG TPA: prepilin-type N-terminal cleavage/methylation domain-containing protein [Verrucomicrobiae bacterium]